MKILIFSDSHGKTENMQDIVNSSDLQVILHCGDYIDDTKSLLCDDKLIFAILGNMDFFNSVQKFMLDQKLAKIKKDIKIIYNRSYEMMLEIQGKKILMLHGHEQNVKRDLTRLSYYAEEKKADICVFGHTHEPCVLKINDILYINPGSINYSSTYCELEISDGDIDVKDAVIITV